MVLHVLNAAPESQAINNCLHQLSTGDPVILMGEATYAAIAGCKAQQSLQATGATLHVLHDDAQLRGVIDRLDANIIVIGMDEFVRLTEQSTTQHSWF